MTNEYDGTMVQVEQRQSIHWHVQEAQFSQLSRKQNHQRRVRGGEKKKKEEKKSYFGLLHSF